MFNNLRTLRLSLICASISAFANDVSAANKDEKSAGERRQAIERQLSSYLEVDDIKGANGFIDRLAEEGELSDVEQQALENLIWRTRAERMLDYARKVREAIHASDLDAMRDYEKRMRRLTADMPDDGSMAGPVAVTSPEPVGPSTDRIELPGEIVAEDAEDVSRAIADLEQQGAEAMAGYHLTRANDGELSALDVVEKLAVLGGEGVTAANSSRAKSWRATRR